MRNLSDSKSGLGLILLWILPLAFLALFYFYPLGSILSLGIGAGAGFVNAVTSPTTLKVLWFTIWQAGLSTLLTLAVGLPGAYLLGRYDFRGKSMLRALTGIPFVLPTVVVAMAFSTLLGPRGWVNLGLMSIFELSQPPIQFTNTLWAILLAHVFYNTTIVLRLVGDFWSRLDPRLEQAAQVLGANRWRTLWQVTLPILMPAILAAALLVFVFDFSSFGVILILGGPKFATLEVEIYNQIIGFNNLSMAAVLSMLQLLATLGLMMTYTRLSAKLNRPLHLRSKGVTQKRLMSMRSKVAAGGLVTFLLLLFALPLVSLGTRSFARFEPERRQTTPLETGLTLDYYKQLANNPRQSMFYAAPTSAILTSLGYASATVLLAITLGFPAAWALTQKTNLRFNQLIDPILMLPLGTSAVTLGLGFIVALDAPPLDLRASPILIPIAHTLVAFPFVVRSLTPALRSIQPRLRQAAAVLGARPVDVFRHIDLPIIRRAALVAAAFAFTISLGEFGASSLITRPEYPTMPVMIFRFLSQPGASNYGQALALSAILMLVTGAGILGIERMRMGAGAEF